MVGAIDEGLSGLKKPNSERDVCGGIQDGKLVRQTCLAVWDSRRF
jgi:hypothetical protein